MTSMTTTSPFPKRRATEYPQRRDRRGAHRRKPSRLRPKSSQLRGPRKRRRSQRPRSRCSSTSCQPSERSAWLMPMAARRRASSGDLVSNMIRRDCKIESRPQPTFQAEGLSSNSSPALWQVSTDRGRVPAKSWTTSHREAATAADHPGLRRMASWAVGPRWTPMKQAPR